MLDAPPPPPAPPPPSNGQIDASKLTKMPKVKKFVPAEYPKEALEKDITADVLLLIDITADGKVSAVSVAEPINPAAANLGFEAAAMAAVKQFEFEPAEAGGKPIAVQINYRYHFKLGPKPAAPPAPAPTPAPGEPAVPAAPAAGDATSPATRAADGSASRSRRAAATRAGASRQLRRPPTRARHAPADARRAGHGVPRRRHRAGRLRGDRRPDRHVPLLRSRARDRGRS